MGTPASLRSRLLFWHGLTLVLVMIVFGTIVCYLAWRARLTDVDDVLRMRAALLTSGLQPVAENAFDLTMPPQSGSVPEALYHAVWAPDGTLIDSSGAHVDLTAVPAPGVRTRAGRREVTVSAAGGAVVLVGHALDELRAEIGLLATTMGGVGLIVAALSLIAGASLVGRTLRPVTRIDATARAMMDGDLAARIPIDRVDTELGQLATALNEAFGRLHEALERQRRFTANASHELRTPLATMLAEIAWALGHERDAIAYRGSLEVCQRAATRMHAIVGRLLTLARAEAMADQPPVGQIDLGECATTIARELRPLAAARGIELTVESESIACRAEPDRLAEAISNVVVNAITYSASGGQVCIGVRASGQHAEVVVEDSGMGISQQDLPHVFEPFFRGEGARQRAPEGAGLGLAVAQATVTRFGGSITCVAKADRGATVTMTLPRAELVSRPVDDA